MRPDYQKLEVKNATISKTVSSGYNSKNTALAARYSRLSLPVLTLLGLAHSPVALLSASGKRRRLRHGTANIQMWSRSHGRSGEKIIYLSAIGTESDSV
jgi:hypothetical protein